MTDRERSLDGTIAGIQPEIIPVEPRTVLDETVIGVALQEAGGENQLDTVTAAIEPVTSAHPYTQIEAIIPEQTQPEGVIDVTRDAEIGAAAGYLAQLVRSNQWTVRTAEGVAPTRADFTGRSGLVDREERVGRTGKTYEKLHLTDRGAQAAHELEAMIQSQTAYSRESYDNVRAYLKKVYEAVKAQYASEPDRQIKNAQLAIARRVIAEVRSNASKAYKAREKEVRQAPARELIAVAVGYLGLANLEQEADLKQVYAYLREHQTEENVSMIRAARQLARLEHQKAQQEAEARALVEAEQTRIAELAAAREAREAAIREKSRRVEGDIRHEQVERGLRGAIRLGGTALVVSLALAATAYISQRAEARRLEAQPTAITMPSIPPVREMNIHVAASAEQQIPKQETAPVTIREAGPISLHVKYTSEAGAQDVQLGYQGVDPRYQFFSMNGLKWEQQQVVARQFSAAAQKMGANEIIGLEYGDVLFDACHSAFYLDRQACGALVDIAAELSDSKGRPKTEKPVLLDKRDSKSNKEYAQVVGWVRVPRYVKDARTGKRREMQIHEYIDYVRTHLRGVQFDGITSTCYIPKGKSLKPMYFLATVTRRIPAGQVPTEYRPQQQGGEYIMAGGEVDPEPQKNEQASVISRARNTLKGVNRAGKSPWEIAKARAARKASTAG